MKNPFKIIGLLIIVAAVIYAMWPSDTVKDHNPITGEGAHEGHDHAHIDPPAVEGLEDTDGIDLGDKAQETGN